MHVGMIYSRVTGMMDNSVSVKVYADFMRADLYRDLKSSYDLFHKDKCFLSLPLRQHSAVTRDICLEATAHRCHTYRSWCLWGLGT